MKQEYFEIGQIVNTFGIKGVVKVNAFTDEPLEFENLKTILIEKNKKLLEFEIQEVKLHKNQILLKIKGIEDINEAEKYKGCYIKLPREKAKKLPENTYFIADLIGLQVYTDNGELLGKVDDIYNSGSADIYVIKDELGKQILLPGIKEVIKQIDVDNEKIIVHLIDGLI
jgi:16S rRNA processing protein RimM